MSNNKGDIVNLIATGNAIDDSHDNCGTGWFIGHFIDLKQGLRSTDKLEVKWGIHVANEVKKISADYTQKGTTLTLLISGSFIIDFPGLKKSVSLKQAGDYVVFAPSVKHSWKAIENSVVVTVRWPSGFPDRQK